MKNYGTLIEVLQNHAEVWIRFYRNYRYGHIDDYRTLIAKQLKNPIIKFSSLNVYLTNADNRLRILWYRYHGNPKTEPNSKSFFKINKNHSVNRGIFKNGPDWQHYVGNRCEDEFARVREMHALYRKISKDSKRFNELAMGNDLRNKYGNGVESLPIRLLIEFE